MEGAAVGRSVLCCRAAIGDAQEDAVEKVYEVVILLQQLSVVFAVPTGFTSRLSRLNRVLRTTDLKR